jgi:hypothetical protein
MFNHAKEGALVKRLLENTGFTPEKLMEIATEAWQHNSFYCKNSARLSCFASGMFNDICREVALWKKGINPGAPIAKQIEEVRTQISRINDQIQESFPVPVELLKRKQNLQERLKNLEIAA